MRNLFSVAVVLLSAYFASGAGLKSESVEQFFVEPQETCTLRWQVDAGELAGPLEYTLRDYAGRPVTTGKAKVTGASVEVALRLERGFCEIEFPAAKQTFGVVALPAWRGPKDPFFAIDSALSWLVRDDSVRQGLIRALARSGIGMSRERLAWGQVNPASGVWHWESPSRYETVRKTCQAAGVEVLEMCHDAPGWLGRVGKYPQDLVQTARAWDVIAGRWKGAWGGLEVWNEPDIFFGDNLPADQYVPLVEAVAHALGRGQVKTPLVGGVVAHYNRRFLDTAARCGMLNVVDAFSFHTYGRAMEMQPLVVNYRDWLRTHGHESMPLWLTECGRPWKRGPERPPADQDATSALDITMKAVEARACGVARYFAFVYPYYDENQNNFGMMDRRATPLRSMAAYVQSVCALAGKDYLGDLKCDDPTIQRARVFGDSQETVLVLYTGKPKAEAKVKLPLPSVRAEGIDGRQLPLAGNETPIPDGLCYVYVERGKTADRLNTDTPAIRLWRLSPLSPRGRGVGGEGGQAKPAVSPRRSVPSPILLRFRFDKSALQAKSEGYRVSDPKVQSRLPIGADIFNLSPQPQEVTVSLVLPEGAKTGASPAEKSLQLPPGSQAKADWILDLSVPLATTGHATLTITAQCKTAGPIAPRVVELAGEMILSQVLRQHPGATALPIGELKRWEPAVAGIGRMSMESTPEAAWRLKASFRPGDRWVYPCLRLPEGQDMRKAAALAIRARCEKPATVRVFLWEGDTGVGYLTPESIIPADGQWHTAVVRISDLVLSTANAPDLNGRLDLDKVDRLSLGMNSQASENTLEVSEAYVLSK